MKDLVQIDYILASSYKLAQQCASISGINPGWKFLYSGAHIYGIRNATLIICECAPTRSDYDYLIDLLATREFIIVSQPYLSELI